MTTGLTLRLQDFEGRWCLERTITDHRARATGRFEGTATFTPDEIGLAYLETGHLILNGQPPFQAQRRYHWRADPHGIVVDFDDGRFFHHFDPAMPQATHWCDPDTYKVTYCFDTWPDWTSTWDVAGPRKAYQMINRYTRATR
ncbi:DUF6314 family protein [Marivita sp.]|uniref:DUF6314 family protein n=1 Tax=Marivita sp. TaxID=2003365 RepID=UPI003F6F2BE3